jgi:hypothetical protein
MSLDMKASAGREPTIRPTIRRVIVKLGTKFLPKRPCEIGRMTTGEIGHGYDSSPFQQPDMAGTGSSWTCHFYRNRTQAIRSESLGAHE